MKKTGKPQAYRSLKGITLIEVVIALMILMFATYFIFEVLITSYSQLTRLKSKTRLAALSSSKIEDILYQGSANDTTWLPYPEDPEYWYQVTAQYIYMDELFPNYIMTKVTLDSKGPVGRVNRPEYFLTIGTVILSYSRNVSATHERRWGQGISREVDRE
jgi:type II secretory pathway pseudopilin PulG